jgi:hypothetical protein
MRNFVPADGTFLGDDRAAFMTAGLGLSTVRIAEYHVALRLWSKQASNAARVTGADRPLSSKASANS